MTFDEWWKDAGHLLIRLQLIDTRIALARAAFAAGREVGVPDLLKACLTARTALQAAVGDVGQLDTAISAIDRAVETACPLAAVLGKETGEQA